jgi:hypothetical protein
MVGEVFPFEMVALSFFDLQIKEVISEAGWRTQLLTFNKKVKA